MAVQDDARYKQINDTIENELGLTKSLRAFSGFGRSTLLGEDVGKVEQKRVALTGQLATVLMLEEMIKNATGNTDSLYEALSGAMAALNKGLQESKERAGKLGEDMTSEGVLAGSKLKNLFTKAAQDTYKSKLSSRFKKLVLSQKNPFTVKSVAITPIKLAKGVSKRNTIFQKGISEIIKSGRGKSLGQSSGGFGRQKTLTSNNA